MAAFQNGNRAIPTVPVKRRRRRPFFSIIACVAITTFGYRLGEQLVAPGVLDAHGLVIAPDNLTLGTQWARRRFEHTLSVRNEGARPVSVAKFQGMCDCISVAPETFDLGPRQSRDIQLYLDLTASPVDGRPVASREVSINLVALINGSPLPARWRLTGTARNPTAPWPAVVEFPRDELIASRAFPSRTVQLSCVPEVVDLRVLSVESEAQVSVRRSHASAGKNGLFLLTIAPAPALPSGPFHFVVGLEATMRSGDCFETTPIAVRGAVVDDIEFMPSAALLPPAPVGETVQATLIVRSRTGRKFTLAADAPTIDQRGLDTLAATHILSIRQPVLKEGSHSDDVRTVIHWKDGSSQSTFFQVRYQGLATAK